MCVMWDSFALYMLIRTFGTESMVIGFSVPYSIYSINSGRALAKKYWATFSNDDVITDMTLLILIFSSKMGVGHGPHALVRPH